MMSDLPFDLVEEILYRVPATSLIRLRSTCKRWNALFKERKFIQNHLRKAAKDSMVLMLKERRVCPVSVNLNLSPPSIEFRGSLGLNDSHSTSEPVEVDIVKVCHCDGLLLCTTNDNRLVVWNPSLGETRWIQLKDDYKRYYNSNFTLGYIQNNESCRSYKILWTYCDNEVWRFEVYDFSSDSWNVLDDINHKSSIIIGRGVSLKGNTYSLAFDLKEKSTMLFSFDFARERFNCLCLPHFQDVRQMVLSVVREEQLSVLNWNCSTSKMEIWITNNIDTEATLSWRLHLDITRPSCPVQVIFSSLLFEEEKRVVLCCNVNDNGTCKNMVCIIGKDDGHYIEIPYVVSTSIRLLLLLPSQKWRIFLFNYVPSLVQIDISSKVD